MIDAKKYIEEIDKKQDKLTSLSDEIWGYAETAFTEFQSVEALQKFFESEGFLVTPHAYGVETAFTAKYGSGTPRVGVLGEFDALSGLSQVSDLIEKKAVTGNKAERKSWLLYAILSAVFASLTSILGKVGIEGVESNLGTAIRTGVVLVMAWLIVFVKGKQHTLKEVPKKELGFICLSGLATGGSWLCYYKALQDGLASVVVPIDKLSILVSIAFSAVVFHERLYKKAALGLVLIVAGTLMMIF